MSRENLKSTSHLFCPPCFQVLLNCIALFKSKMFNWISQLQMYAHSTTCRHVLYSINFLNICLSFWCLFIFTSCVCSCSKFLICCRPRLFCVSIQLQTLLAFLSYYKHFCVDQKSILVSCVCPLFEFLNHCRPKIFSVDIWLQAFSSLHHDVLGDIGMSHTSMFSPLYFCVKGMCGHLVT